MTEEVTKEHPKAQTSSSAETRPYHFQKLLLLMRCKTFSSQCAGYVGKIPSTKFCGRGSIFLNPGCFLLTSRDRLCHCRHKKRHHPHML